MRFLFYRYGSICEPDMIAALEELGHEVHTIELEVTNKATTPKEALEAVQAELFARSYHAVISINYYPILSSVCNIFKIRYISWTVDSPVMELYSHTISNEWNRTFLFDRIQYETFHPRNPDRIFYLPLAVNISRLDRFFDSDSARNSEQFRSEISFVGSLYTEKCPYDRVFCGAQVASRITVPALSVPPETESSESLPPPVGGVGSSGLLKSIIISLISARTSADSLFLNSTRSNGTNGGSV